MGFLTVNETTDVGLFYLDSGPVNNASTPYTTIFFLHGHSFHSPIFSRLLPLAPSYNFRVVAITRRDYPGSTPFNEEELRIAQHGSAKERSAFLRQRAVEILLFVEKFIKRYDLPKRRDNGDGGVVLAGWSLGTVQGLSCLAFAKEIDVAKRLDDWMKAYVIYESSLGGYAPPVGSNWYHPINDTSIPKSERMTHFTAWITGYFKHPDIAALELADRPSAHRPPSESTFTEQDRASFIDPTVGARSEDPFFNIDLSVTQGIRREAISPEGNVVWPQLDIKLIMADETAPGVIYADNQLEKEIEMWRQQGRYVRNFERRVLTGANHFAHWDMPNELLGLFADMLLPPRK